MRLKLFFYLFLTVIFISACSKESKTVLSDKPVDVLESPQAVAETEESVQSEQIQPSPDVVASVSEVGPEQLSSTATLLKPTLPEGVNSELILQSRPIPGKPIIAIYKVWEGDNSKEKPKIPLKPNIAPAVKPEPTIAITPEPTVAPVPEPAMEPDNVVTAVPAEPDPIIQPELEQIRPVVIADPEPTLQPVMEPNNVDTAVPAEPDPVEQPEMTQTPSLVQEPEPTPVIADIAPPHIVITSPLTGTFYTKKIQIEG